MTKTAFRCVQIVLLFYGVFGADEDEVKSVSVMEGDSVTLDPDQTQIKRINLIEWRFRGPVIAQTIGKNVLYPNYTQIFGGRLELDLTGSLTIKNIKTKHSGLYELQISHGAGTAERKFSVTVYESPSVIDPGKAEMKSVSVMSGDPVTLQTGVTQISGDELIVWRCGDEGKLIAKADIEAKSSPLYYDERFRDRLELELDQTGSLTITNTRYTDSGLYSVKISSRTQTVYKRFTVTVSGLSPGGKAGIVLLVLAVVVAAAAAGFIYYRRKISELRKQILTVTVTRTKGEDVILKPNKTIQKGDVILWMFGEEETQTSIAKFIGETGEIVTHDDAVGGRFSGRLKLDETTGSLIIRNSRTTHSGLYKLYIRSSSGYSQQRFIVTVSERVEEKSVEEGGSVTLKPDTEILEDDEILWMFGDQYALIAQVREETGEICINHDDDAAEGRFRGRLKMEKTGSLTITNIKPEHIGPYELEISSGSISSRRTLFKKFRVSIPFERVYVTEGKSVLLSTDRPEIERDDVIQWSFRDEIIAEIKEGTGKTHDGPDGRFRDRLQLNDQTGDLTIKNSTDEHTGRYKLKISNSKGNTNRTYSVTIRGRRVFVTAGKSVRLFTDRPKIERDDVIEWMFGGEIIAEIKEGTGKIHDGADWRFRDRLQLDDQTGDLTIKNCTDEHEGDYKLKISNSKGNKDKIYSVTITGRDVFVTEGESVRLFTDRPKIERDDEIQWMFGDEIIAEIKEGTGETHDGPADGRFRDRLELNDRTGDLTIKNCTDKHEGYYQLKIRSSKGNTDRAYSVTIKVNRVYVTEGESVHLPTDRPKIERDDVIQWRFGDEIIAEIKGRTGKTHDGADGRFRDRLELDKITGDLTIKSSTAEHTGRYNLKIISSKGNTNRTYSVTIKGRHVYVPEGESVRLFTDRPKIERDDVIQWMFRDEIIAEIKEGTGKIHDGAAERFRDRLQLNDQTGDLTIKNSTAEDEGDYKLKIRNSKGNKDKTYSVTIRDEGKRVSVTEGESVHLSTDRPKIERDDEIQWRFRDEIIAEIKEGTRKTHDGADGRFRDRLELNKITGDLTIKSSTDEDEGDYKLKIRSSKGNTDRTYSVTIKGRHVYVPEGESVRLFTDRPKIERDDEIQWRFGDEIIAEIKEGTGETHDGAADGRFRDRLELNDQTGDLTIKNCAAKDGVYYNLKIRSSKGNRNRAYRVRVTYKPREKSPVKGNNDESVVEMQPLMIK